jgi:predicted nicotinamide N-methyase
MKLFPSKKLLAEYAPLKPLPKYNELLAHQADDVFALWDAWEKESGREREIPFWAAVWPGGVSLAHYLLNNSQNVAGKLVLDIGCGGGIAAIAASRAGAQKVIANDIDPVALHIANLNAKANKAGIVTDQTNLLKEKNIAPLFDVILVADMFYERSKAQPMIEFLQKNHKQGATVFIADGERKYAPKKSFKLLHEEKIPVNKDLEGVKERNVRLLSLIN